MTTFNRSRLDGELTELQENIKRLASMVEDAIKKAMQALEERNSQLADEVITGDEEINVLRYEIEQSCLTILATQMPAATDLRQVLAANHIVVELERMGDHAGGIAALVKRLENDAEFHSIYKLPKMANRAIQMLQMSIDAYLKMDEKSAFSVIDLDDKLDRQYAKLFRNAIGEMQDETYVRQATFLLWVGHNIERIGDRATNIAERVIFMVTGLYIGVDRYEPADTEGDYDDE